VRPDTHSVGALLEAYAQRGDGAGAARTAAEMHARHSVPLGCVSYTHIIRAYGRAGAAGSALAWFVQALDDGIEPDLGLLLAAVEACAGSADTPAPLAATASALPLPALLALADACVAAVQPILVARLHRAAAAHSLAASARLLEALVHAHARASEAAQAEAALWRLHSLQGSPPNQRLCETVAQAYAGAGAADDADRIRSGARV
jgi:pentatricopeptide repeat protein